MRRTLPSLLRKYSLEETKPYAPELLLQRVRSEGAQAAVLLGNAAGKDEVPWECTATRNIYAEETVSRTVSYIKQLLCEQKLTQGFIV